MAQSHVRSCSTATIPTVARLLAVSALLLPLAAGAAVSGWRGDGSGRFQDVKLPADWSATNGFAWKVAMPRWSNASPVPAGDRLFLCVEPSVLLCVSAADGNALWQASNGLDQVATPEEWAQYLDQKKKTDDLGQVVGKAQERLKQLAPLLSTATNKDQIAALAKEIDSRVKSVVETWEPVPLVPKYTLSGTHGETGYTTATPVTDGRRVWALFGNGVAACYTVDGKRLWVRLLEQTKQGFGHSSSPLLSDGKLILAINDIHALNAETGEPVWRVPAAARFGTPALAAIGGKRVVITAGGQIIADDDGKLLAAKVSETSYNTPILVDGTVVVVADGRVSAWKLPAEATGDTVKLEKAWQTAIAGGRQFASPVCKDGLIFTINEGGLLTALDAKTGEKLKEQKLTLNGICYPSLTLCGDRLLAFSAGGSAVVVQADRECRELSRHAFEPIRSSPVSAGGRLYVRGLQNLYCFGLP